MTSLVVPSRIPLLLACSFVLPSLTAAQGSPATIDQAITLGAYYADGDYGEDANTEIRYFPISYEFNRGNWGFQLLAPHLEVTGLGNVLINAGGVTRAVAGSEVTSSSGMGDSIATLIYRLDPASLEAPLVEMRLDVKVPTADEAKSLGTGEVDYSLQVDVTKYVGNSALFATVGYNFRGESDIFQGLEDSAFAQLGFALPLNARWSAGMFYDFREPASSFVEETHELVPYINWQLSERWSITGQASWGFTDASADLAVFGLLRYSW